MGASGINAALLRSADVLSTAVTERLPAIASTLAGLIKATEGAAQKVLDEVEGCAAARDRLCVGLVRLKPFIAGSEPAAQAACQEVIDAVRAVSNRFEPIITAMEFQDLTAQHLRAGIGAVEEVRERLAEILRLMDISVTSEAAGPVTVAAKVSAPAAKSPWRQALADELINERTGRQ